MDKMKKSIRQQYYWPGKTKQIESYIQGCPICAIKPQKRLIKADAVIIEPAQSPFEIMNLDKFTLEGKDFLLFEESLTRYVWTTPVRKYKIAELVKEFFHSIPTPKKLITDNKSLFTSKEMQTLTALLGIKQIKISAYHPQSNRIAERVIGTIKRLAATLEGEVTQKIIKATKLYNNSPHSITNYVPEELLFAKPKEFPYDREEYLQDRAERAQAQREDAVKRAGKAKIVNQKKIIRTAKEETYSSGEYVLIKTMTNGKPTWTKPLAVLDVNNDNKTVTLFFNG
ncbi:uncharacterized protein K02A2.6-like [Belonocnema kinseyi]|uniref:uncharacterized protein K02A2.6-like n=1 Tax=Belonocnema kinseyi TaxID=2817044 RepID=UPI00143DB726|nr:uncharacterized protein K02A2.6-like [Belonocnema kinseyi]